MPLYHRENQFVGVNPHLQSYLQATPGAWEKFHLNFIVTLSKVINQALPAGYYALCPESFQMREFFEFGEPEYLRSVVIGTPDSGERLLIRPLVQIELMSQSNKYPKAPRTPEEEEKGWNLNHQPTYVQQRAALLKTETILIEIDLLHEQRPALDAVPSYKDGAMNSYPFWVMVTNPRGTTLEDRKGRFAGIHVGEPLPVLTLPLPNIDPVEVDLNVVYNRTFLSRPQYGEAIVDYSQKPMNANLYSLVDQEHLEKALKGIQKALK